MKDFGCLLTLVVVCLLVVGCGPSQTDESGKTGAEDTAPAGGSGQEGSDKTTETPGAGNDASDATTGIDNTTDGGDLQVTVPPLGGDDQTTAAKTDKPKKSVFKSLGRALTKGVVNSGDEDGQ